jgi:hypothetical protein
MAHHGSEKANAAIQGGEQLHEPEHHHGLATACSGTGHINTLYLYCLLFGATSWAPAIILVEDHAVFSMTKGYRDVTR